MKKVRLNVTPLEALRRTMFIPHMMCSRRYTGPKSRPGEVIERASDEDRKALQRLTSADFDNEWLSTVRMWVEIENGERRRQLSQRLLLPDQNRS